MARDSGARSPGSRPTPTTNRHGGAGACRHTLAKRERVGLHTRIEEFDGERPVPNLPGLSYQLIQALTAYRAGTVRRNVGAMCRPRRGTVDGHAEPDRFRVRGRSHHEVQVSRVEAIDNLS